ncbi:caspase family protein [Streptomyces sp. NPDC005921]|uniref:HD domain-containing protein n=1 Tax=Streptomyces sp. NPDC005827 TaxID=3157070 RepID=UPI0033C6BDD7
MGAEETETLAPGRRRALVVGVVRTPALERDQHLAERFPTLDGASEDVELVGRSLRQSCYEVTQLTDPGGAELLGTLQEFFDACKPGDTAFLYFSCHGVTLGNRDYLLPADAQPGRAAPDGIRPLLDRTLLPADPDGLLDALPSGVTTVVCLDTCRTEDPTVASEQSRKTVLTAAEDVYWLYSCSRGQRSYADPQEGSWFGRALAKALAPTTQPTTFADLVRYTQAAVRRTASDAGLRPPTVERYVPHGKADESPSPVLCEGAQEAYRWTTMIETSCLWEYTSGGTAVHERVRKRLGALVEHIVDSLSTEGAHRADPWADPTYPVRVVEQLGTLVKRARLEGRDLLSPAETAALLAAPIVHEGIVAVALEELRRALPNGMDIRAAPDEPAAGHHPAHDHDRLVRGAAHDVCRAHSQVRRTTATLRRRGLQEQAAAADHWLRHRFITEWDLLWERTGAYASVDRILDLLTEAVLDSGGDPSAAPVRPAVRAAVDSQLRQVLGHLAVQPSSSPRINDTPGGDEWRLYPPVPGNQWRAPDLARLLWTAGLLAADPRRMSSVLVDHLGAHEPLAPAEVVAALSADFGYDVTPLGENENGSYELTVRFACPHPALHVAAEELAARANTTVNLLHLEWQKQRTTPPALLRGFPERVTGEQLVPLDDRYKQPLERFRLAEDEIRPLLMGTQLYGDRMLAVRELYQNALDACRYRDMRRQYGVMRGRPELDWTPKISFTQGWDRDGRPYIECTDNGSGMSRAKLTSMFARAGKRYEQDPEFVQERRNWRRAGLSEMPLNSRFGIGVFSYFMLAEEVVVWTSPVDHYGRAERADPLRADIQSGSGLLRISNDPAVALDGGTRVRLYLGQDEERPPSMVETLESFLWVADFAVEAVELGREPADGPVRRSSWKPYELTAPEPAHWAFDAVQGSRDVWLVQGPSVCLLDGVRIRDNADTKDQYGYVINLRERHRPEPSVDRNTLISYDTDAVTAEVLASVPRAVAQWNTVRLNWLWQLSEASPRFAIAVLNSLPAHVQAVVEQPNPVKRPTILVPLARAGCLPMDAENQRIKSRLSFRMSEYEGVLANQWRSTRLGLRPHGRHPFAPPGYPTPGSMDSVLFQSEIDPDGWASVIRASVRSGAPLGTALRALRRYAIIGFEVPAAADIRALRDVRPSEALLDLATGYRNVLRSYAPEGRRPAVHTPLLQVAAAHQLSLGAAAALLEQLRTWEPDLPVGPELSTELAAEVPTPQDATMLAGRNYRSPDGPVWPGALDIMDLLTRPNPSGSVHTLAARARHFRPLGFSLRSEPSQAALSHGALPASEQPLFTIPRGSYLRNTEYRDSDLSVVDLLLVSAELGIQPGTVASRVNALTLVTGIHAAQPPAEISGVIPSELAVRVLRRMSAGQWEDVSPWRFVMTVHKNSSTRTDRFSFTAEGHDVEEALRFLSAAGLLSSDFEAAKDQVVRQLDVWDHPLKRGNNFRDELELDQEGVTLCLLTELSAFERLPIGDLVDQLTDEEQPLRLRVAPPSAEVLDLQATHSDVTALVSARKGFYPELAFHRLLKHAQETHRTIPASIEHLARFVPLGAAPPPCTPAEAAALGDLVPDIFDLGAFDPGLIGKGPLGPLELVRTAGRFGWSLGRTYDRYAPLSCLGLDVTVRQPTSDEGTLVPDWRDLIILTPQLTGRHPVLTGAVAKDHIALCSEETDLSEAEVRERLARYARLFSLEFPPEATEGTSE